jgi:hypothetical protein
MRPDDKDIEITDESGATSGAGVSEEETTANEAENSGSAGTLPYNAEFDRIPVGNTGSNVRQDRNLEKSSAGEEKQ